MFTSKPRRAFSLIPLLLAAALSACGGGGDAPAATPADLDAVRRSTLTLTAVAGATGRPALSVPVLSAPGPGGAPAPLGLCLVGPRGSDLALLEFGQALAGVIA